VARWLGRTAAQWRPPLGPNAVGAPCAETATRRRESPAAPPKPIANSVSSGMNSSARPKPRSRGVSHSLAVNSAEWATRCEEEP
jgi:hypothetical protein